MATFEPIASFADLRHEFGEHGGVNMSDLKVVGRADLGPLTESEESHA